MGQKTNPIGLRLGIIKGWDSNWYGGRDFSAKLVEDDQIRKYLNARLGKAGISKISIERSLKLVTVTISTARPGMIIGKGGQEVDKLKEELKKLTGKKYRSTSARSKGLSLMPTSWQLPSPSKSKVVFLSAGLSKLPSPRVCALVPKASR